MSKQLVPKLRFPEFQDAGEWEEAKLADLIFTIAPPKKLLSSTYLTKGLFPIVDQSQNYICGWTDDHEAVIKKPLPLIVFGDHTCSLKKVSEPFAQGADGIKILKTKPPVKNEYLYQFLKHNQIVMNEYKRHFSILKEKMIIFPKVESGEQKKIANCLLSLDDLIAAQAEKLKALKKHKKGLMQQLFPKEGKTKPDLRFPEFRDAGGWEEKYLEELYSFQVTNSYPREKLNYKEGSVKNIHYGDIHTKFAVLFNIQNEIVPFVNPQVSLEKIKPQSYCIEGDMVFADASEDLDDIGKCIEVVKLNDEKLLSGLHTLLARQKRKKIIIGFGGYLFKSDFIRNQIKKEAQGAKVLGISIKRLSTISIRFPSKKEQKKIADCLSSLDDLISAQTKKIEALKKHKKGLMQQLFPSNEQGNGGN